MVKTYEGIIKHLRDDIEAQENKDLKAEVEVKTDMLKNMILTMVSICSGYGEEDFGISSHSIESDYIIDDYNKLTHQFYNTLCKEMNDTDWNDDEKRTTLIYNDNYNISTEFKDDSDDE